MFPYDFGLSGSNDICLLQDPVICSQLPVSKRLDLPLWSFYYLGVAMIRYPEVPNLIA